MPSKFAPTTTRARATHCRQCERPKSVCGELSARALCVDCGEANMTRAARELATQSGPAWDQYIIGVTEHARRLSRLRG